MKKTVVTPLLCLISILLGTISVSAQRVLIDIGGDANHGGVLTTSPNLNGNFWNNMTDAREGIRVSNALTTNNVPSGINIEVISRVDGTYNTASLGIGGGNNVGVVGDYPASATTDHALVHSSATTGKWRVSGLNSNNTYSIKFWGTRSNTTASRSIEIKRTDETIWQSYNATANTDYTNAAVFSFTGKTSMDFDIRTKAGSDFSAINVLDITVGGSGPAPLPTNQPPVAIAASDSTLQLPTDSLFLRGCLSYDPENAALKYKWAKIAGPASFSLPNDSLCSVEVKSLVAGLYRFELTVTDPGGLTGKDTMAITVNTSVTTSWPGPVTAFCNLPYKIVIVGSSTAYGTGASPIDSSWARKYRAYMLQQGQQVTVVNLATPGLTSWDVSPTGTYTPYPFTIDTARNITKALTLHPDAIILSLPSNDVARGIPVDSIHRNFARIVALADAQHIPVWVTTTQPRNGLSLSEKTFQIALKDWINTTYGNKAVDFWSTVANADGTINSFYSFGDGVHLNNYGHHVLFTRMVQENLWDSVCLRRGTNFPPVAKAGNDTLIVGNSASYNLNGLKSFDPEGGALLFNWRLLTMQGCSLSGTTTANPLFTAFIAGAFIVELTVQDAAGLSAKDSILIRVNPNNVLPISNAGQDQVLTLPNHIAILNGSGSSDPDGTIALYRWRKISGPGSAIISDTTAAQTSVDLSTAGLYLFELKVTDNAGAFSRDTVNFTVNSASNLPPVSSAGPDQFLTLPNHIVNLNGSNSSDPDGTIVSYRWRKVSGPGTVIISDTTAIQTLVDFSTAGIYLFELKVVDNFGAIARDSISVTLSASGNQPPVANAGADKAITLPTSSALLDGRSSYDPEASKLSFQWQFLNGPSGARISNSSNDSTTVSFTNSGNYSFRLTVTDTGGLSTYDDVVITVQPVASISKRINVNIYGGVNPYTNSQWNNWDMTVSPISSKFNYDDGSISNIYASITSTGIISDNGAGYGSGATVCPPQVLRYNSANSSARTLSIIGLNTNQLFSLEFYASRSNTGNSSVFKIGNSFDTISTSNNVNDFAKFTNVRSDVTGKINIDISRIGTWNYLAGFQVSEQPAALAPRSSWESKFSENSLRARNGVGDLSYYPNPAHDFITVNIPSDFPGDYTMQLSDATGSVVKKINGSKSRGITTANINVRNLSNGVYFLKLSCGNKTTTGKIIKF